MTTAWYAILAAMFVVFAATEGRNFGAGALHLLVARTRAERRMVVRAIGPLWSWHEVWLIAAGGVLFLAFPKVLATALSGYYLAVFLLLWCLVLRGIALEVGGHVDDPLWQTFWDAVLAASSLLLALLFGAAFGNVVRGVPLGADGKMFLPFFTDFRATGRVGILDWYTVSVAVFTLSVLGAHGATHLARATTGPVEERSTRIARQLWMVVLILLPIVSWETGIVRPGFFEAVLHRSVAWLGAAALVLGLAAVLIGLSSGKASLASAGSSAVIAGLLGGAATAMFPELLHSTVAAAHSITATSGASGSYGLGAALVWWPVAAGLSVTYAWLMARRYPRRVLGEGDDY